MNFEEFSKLANEKIQKNPIWFQLERDAPSNDEEVIRVESNLGIQLPDEYKQFVKTYGGGYFAFSIVYSPNPNSDFPLEKINTDNTFDTYILFSENGSGDYYGFPVSDKKCSSSIFFWDHESGQWNGTEYLNFYCFLADKALSSE
ncbi:SMI1/KNR4 family protein [Pseudomonas xanthosomatis]|uniref:SMI1/KNR4 family protein n=1 Tax=Pseudomonas xanthosomatis TaxID=2842356 RepID=UPI001C3D0B51|nr:SMI1/KNR4 family protein [Pseudomonas xanthosomatis]QXH44770.1 SMI1/KNR4 family protein [Pseudomonas xanthosomatis]